MIRNNDIFQINYVPAGPLSTPDLSLLLNFYLKSPEIGQSAGTLTAVLSSGWLVRLLHGEHCSAAASTVSQSTSEHTAGLSGHQGRCVITRDQADTLQSCQLYHFIWNIRCCVGVV